ncbi:glycosyltransferase [bacterium]|nr:MAG: glycosyltransferase [bacterium]
MKICLVSNLYSPYAVGGAEIYVEKIAKRLSSLHEVSVITTQPFQNFSSLKYSLIKQNGIKIYSFYPINIYHLLRLRYKPVFIKPFWHALDIWNHHSYFTVNRILHEENPDIVHTHNLNGISLSVIDSIKKAGLPLVHTCHDFSLLCPYANLSCSLNKEDYCPQPVLPCSIYRKFKKMVIDDKPDIVIFPSRSTGDIYLKNNFFKNAKREILHYCVDAPSIPSLEFKEDNCFNILYVGQLVKHKGVQVLINAFRNLQNQNLKLHIVGDGAYKKELQNFSEGDKRIIFHGKIPNKDIWRFYSLAQLTVVPSIWPEVLGIVILESLSMGTPVIGSNIGGISEVINDGFNGLIFKPADARGLKNILEKIILSPTLLKELGVNALNSSFAFGIEQHLTKLSQIYSKAIGLARHKN